MESIIGSINISSILAVITATIAVYVTFLKVLFQRKKLLREDYVFISKFLEKYKSNDSDMHPLEIEAGMLAYIGEPLTTNEIKLLLSPKYQIMGMLGLKNYTNARRLLDINEQGFSYKAEYQNKKSRTFKFIFKLAGYIIWSAFAYFPLYYLIDIYQIMGLEGIIKAMGLSIVSGIVTYYYLKELTRFNSAKCLLKEAKKEQECVKDITYPMTEEIKET